MTMKDSRELGKILDNMPGWTRGEKNFRFGEHGYQRSWVKKGKYEWEKSTWLPAKSGD